MSACLDSLLDAERLADIARHDAQASCAAPMRRFLVAIGPRENPRLYFEVYATDSSAATEGNIVLAHPGERMDVRPI